MAASMVEVLCPTGHRQKVKITPNMAILQILEEVCTKRGFSPPEEYELKHGRRTLDLTLNIRFAGIPNHGKLELVKAQTVRAESDVTLALQVDDVRLQTTFSPGTTLWGVLQHWENKPDSNLKNKLTSGFEPGAHPVMTYMREEVVGEFALGETTLRMLGLTTGRAMMRYSCRPVDENILITIQEKIEKEKNRQAKIQNKARADSAMEVNQPAPPPTKTCDLNMETETVTSSAKKEEEEKGKEVEQPMETEVAETKEDELEKVVTSGSQALSDGSLRGGMSESQRREASLSQLENMPGVEVIRPDDFSQLSQADQERARRMAAEAFPGLFPQSGRGGGRPKIKQQRQPQPIKPPDMPFANFKFPEETKGKEVYSNELSEVKKEEFQPCERETTLYNLDEVKTFTESEDDLPDDFFDITINDVQKMYASLQTNLQSMEGQMLMTSQMRRQADEEKMSRYPRVVIRVQFPDRIVLQGIFRPRETVFALQKFVKEHLEEKSTPFYLYTTPPKYVLKDNSKTLYEANLIPLSVVYFGSETKKDHYISTAALGELSSRAAADRIVCSHMGGSDGNSSSSSTSRNKRPMKAEGSGAAPSTSGARSDPPKVPKWFKVGKK